MNKNLLFFASCLSLVVTSMSFAIRGDIMGDFERIHVRPYLGLPAADAEPAGEAAEGAADADAEGVADAEADAGAGDAEVEAAPATDGADESESQAKTMLGLIAGVAFFSFGLAIVLGGPLVDLLGMGNLLRLAAICHIGGTVLTIVAPEGAFYMVVAATLIVGAGNGIVEAVCNPLVATLYPNEKAHKLTVFHAWFPGGIVIGGLLCYAFTRLGLGWQIKMGLLIPPAVVYLLLIFSQKFPATERVASGVSFGDMFVEAARRPLFWVLAIMMWCTAATELGTGAWISNIYQDVMGSKEGILALVWGSILMYILRQFFSKTAHKLSPVGLIATTAPFAAVGLFLFKTAAEQESPPLFFVAATLVYFGVCFWWPTMLGITSERLPRTGAFGLGVIGGIGSFATFFAGPIIGKINDTYGPARALQVWAVLPVAILIVFTLMFLNDKARGGYQIEKLAALDGVAEPGSEEAVAIIEEEIEEAQDGDEA